MIGLYDEEYYLMALFKLRRHAQVTILADLSRPFNLQEDTYREAEAVESGLLIKSVSVLAREQAWQQMRGAMTQVVDQEPCW